MAETTIVVKDVRFDVTIHGPSHLDGPTMEFLTNYEVHPYALIHVSLLYS
jgi:hypothetical protein